MGKNACSRFFMPVTVADRQKNAALLAKNINRDCQQEKLVIKYFWWNGSQGYSVSMPPPIGTDAEGGYKNGHKKCRIGNKNA